jgi:uncharacterized repeat protein (TIGR01451 family)
MSLILGILAQSGGAPVVPNSYESIATVTVGGGGSATITFSSIPSTYKHLQLRTLARTARAADSDRFAITINSDTAGNYADHYLFGDGSSAAAGADINQTAAFVYDSAVGNTGTANAFGVTVIDILDYTDTNKFRTFRALSANDRNGSGSISFMSDLYRSTSAITSIDIVALGNFNQYSQLALYGIKD